MQNLKNKINIMKITLRDTLGTFWDRMVLHCERFLTNINHVFYIKKRNNNRNVLLSTTYRNFFGKEILSFI